MIIKTQYAEYVIDKSETSKHIVSGLMCSNCEYWQKNGFINPKTGEVQGKCSYFGYAPTVHYNYCTYFSNLKF